MYQPTPPRRPERTTTGLASIALRRRVGAVLVLSLITATLPTAALATPDPGALDTSFSEDGIVEIDAKAEAMALDSAGRIIIAGQADHYTWKVARYDTNGDLDTSFGSGGSLSLDPPGTLLDPPHIAIDSSGSIYLAGPVLQTSGTSDDFVVAKLTDSGTLVSSFGNGEVDDDDGLLIVDFSGGSDNADDIALVGSDLVVVGHARTEPSSGHNQAAFIRFTADGTLVSDFGTSGKLVFDIEDGTNTFCNAVAVDADDNIVAGCDAQTPQGTGYMVRLDGNGALDATFGTDGVVELPSIEWLGTLSIDSSGRILGAGWNDNQMAVVRVTDDGMDGTFGTGGLVTLKPEQAYGVAAVPSGVLVAGWHDEWNSTLAKLDLSGTLVTGFSTDGYADQTDGMRGRQVAVDSQGRYLMIAEHPATFTSRLYRFNGDAPVVEEAPAGDPLRTCLFNDHSFMRPMDGWHVPCWQFPDWADSPDGFDQWQDEAARFGAINGVDIGDAGDATVTRLGFAEMVHDLTGPTAPGATHGFADVGDHPALDWLTAAGGVVDTTNGTFDPDAPITRAHLIAILWRLTGEPAVETPHPFADVDAWIDEPLRWASSVGVTLGRTEDTFDPDTPATMGEVLVFLHRWANSL